MDRKLSDLNAADPRTVLALRFILILSAYVCLSAKLSLLPTLPTWHPHVQLIDSFHSEYVVKRINFEGPHCVIFSTLLLLSLSAVQIFSHVIYSQTPPNTCLRCGERPGSYSNNTAGKNPVLCILICRFLDTRQKNEGGEPFPHLTCS
jgi:hypothetical protein